MENHVRRLRKQLKLSALDLADRVGVAESTILRIESGRITHPRRITREAIARALRSRPEDVFPEVSLE